MFSSHLTRATRSAIAFQRAFSQDLHTSLTTSETPYVVDVRERSEIDRTGTIPGAIPLPRGILERDIGKFIPQDDPRNVVVYCAGGFRSILAAESLTRLGYGTGESEAKNKVYSLDEGMDGWIKSGFRVEKK
ncbi:MAG: Rhodanese-like domain-containing protein [Podila humilis]|nr:MAG: Rhodanese-like domain-containing protein [Podila humilis]